MVEWTILVDYLVESVNLALLQLGTPEYPSTKRAALLRYGVAAEQERLLHG